MFCYQCEQTGQGTGCTTYGVCGKDPTTAALQDLILYVAKGISAYAHRARGLGAKDADVDRYVIEALFTTVTNVNFDPKRLEDILRRGLAVRDRARDLYEAAVRGGGEEPVNLTDGPVTWAASSDLSGLLDQHAAIGIEARREADGDDVVGLQELLTYGLKGAAAYADHAMILGVEDERVWAFFHEALSYLAGNPIDVGELTTMCLRCGEVNYRVMELLDGANTETYGHPVPTSVRTEPLSGKAILVSGHDLKDLHELLVQTEGLGVNVYTHGEMLPAHGYPGLNRFAHLAGNYGGAWQDQQKEFDAFPGAILMTTNCIQKPAESYVDRIFTTGLVAWPNVTHVTNRDFTPVIDAALAAPGFSEDGQDRSITVGFGRDAVMGVAGLVIDAVKDGKIRHFFLIGGCDGAKPGRNYYTDLAQAVPEDCVILTLACGKYRFNKLDFGAIDGIPRLLDIGQCNDAYSAIRIALALADAFETDVTSLPLSMILSWYEQKAVVILLTLLHLGIKNIRIGPSLPAFVTPAVLDTLVEGFGLTPITTPERDLAAILG
ncbi:hydroxylamine reductase [Candidatus Bipolaricaulota bacterium]